MRRRAAVCACHRLSRRPSLAAVPCRAAASSQASAVSFVQVVQKEFTLTLSRPAVQRGTVSVELVNFGMDAHDLIVLKKTRVRSRSPSSGSTPAGARTAR